MGRWAVLTALCALLAVGCSETYPEATYDLGAPPAPDAASDLGASPDQGGAPDVAADPGAPDPGSMTDLEAHSEQWIGTSCTCEGSGCDNLSVPLPPGGTLVGCDDVPGDWTGGAPVCLRSYAGDLANDTFFANGFCSLMATRCTGSELICGSAVFGDYDAMVGCPAGAVMLAFSQDVAVDLGQRFEATIDTKACAPRCASDADCRAGETDPELGDEVTQYGCQTADGMSFCYDPRNLPATYSVAP